MIAVGVLCGLVLAMLSACGGGNTASSFGTARSSVADPDAAAPVTLATDEQPSMPIATAMQAASAVTGVPAAAPPPVAPPAATASPTVPVTPTPAPAPAPPAMPPVAMAPAPTAAPVLPTPRIGAPFIDNTKLAKAAVGDSAIRIQPTAELASNGGGEFRTTCGMSGMSYDDPIVFPGQPGRAHLHTFFGNTGTNAHSTAESLRTTGNSTCRGGIANRSAYWVPTMIDTKDGTPIVPAGNGIYYKAGILDGAIVQAIPAGLRIIAGDPGASGPKQEFSSRFKCIGGPNNSNDQYGPTIPNCDKGAELWQEIFFPQCWDGKNLDSPDHKSHMSYLSHSLQRSYYCPDSHPIALPQISFNVIYVVMEKDAPLRWRLSSDVYDKSIPGGYSSHGDWFNGWIPEVSDAWSMHCVNKRKDCQSHLLGDGRMIF